MVGPHFETICRLWVNRYASPETLGGPTGPARRLQFNHRDRTRSFELDIAAPALEPASGSRRVVVQAIGEANATRLDLSDLARLDRIAGLLTRHQRISRRPPPSASSSP